MSDVLVSVLLIFLLFAWMPAAEWIMHKVLRWPVLRGHGESTRERHDNLGGM